jgi:DNA-binding response OmpR family regulator
MCASERLVPQPYAVPPFPGPYAPLAEADSGGPPFDRPSGALSPSSEGSAARPRHDILVVDDDPDVRETLCLALQDAGHQVAVAADGAQALDLLRRGHYRTLLLDLMLPGLDGFAVLQRLRAEPALRPPVVLVLSALQRRADVLAALEAGADDYLAKPFDLDDLTLHVDLWLRRAGAALSPPGLRVHSLGRFYVEHAGQIRLHPGTYPRKASILFLYLLTQHEHRVHKGEVLRRLWPHTPDDLRATSLRTLLYRVRRLLGVPAHGPSCLQADETTLTLRLGPEDWWDVAEFSAWLAEGARWQHSGETARALDAYAAGVALYGGDYLEEEPAADWARPLRERLREEWLRALSTMAQLHGELGQQSEQEAVLRRLLQVAPYREPDRRALMALLVTQGRNAEALLLYRELEALLRTALGASPAPETQALAARIAEAGPGS